MKYALEELRLLSMVMRCYWDQQFSMSSDDGESVSSGSSTGSSGYSLTLTTSQLMAIRRLEDHLIQYTYNSNMLQRLINNLTEALYMPENSHNMVSDIFVSPVASFMCLRAVNRVGGFSVSKHITTRWVGLQCGIRLCIFDVAMEKWRQVMESNGLVPTNWFE